MQPIVTQQIENTNIGDSSNDHKEIVIVNPKHSNDVDSPTLNHYNNIFKYSPFAIALRSGNTFIEVNKSFETLFGYSRTELIGGNRYLIKREEDKEDADSQHQKLIEGEIDSYTHIVKYYRKDGTHLWGQVTRSKLKTQAGDCIMSSIIDVSRQRRAELQLIRSEHQYKQLFDHSLNAIAVYDIEKNHYVNCNRPFIKIYGYCQEDLKNISALDLTWDDIDADNEVYKERYQDNIRRLKNDETIKFESIHKSKDGKKLLVEIVLIPYYIDGKLYIKQVTKDTTEEKQATKKLDNKMKELNQANDALKEYIESNLQLENFAYITSHDLREPVRTIVGFSQVLKRKIEHKLEPEDLEFLDYVIGAGKNLNTLIEDILAFSRVNNKDASFDKLDIHEILDSVLIDLHTIIENNNVTINLPETLPVEINGHRSYLYQLFQNLIKNAVKFRHADRPAVITVGYKDIGEHHQFYVKDNGIGINSDYFDKIFLIFKKLHTREKYDGTGIGLAICKKVAEIHAGTIWVESEQGVGTTFYFTIGKTKPKSII